VTKERDHNDRDQQACRDLPAQALGGGRHGGRITGNRSYTRAHFLYYAGVVQPGTYR
jgi:hypothetical protein